jgi:TPP-dependent pyruvate/acetoin dehydrogenase alpha subunit
MLLRLTDDDLQKAYYLMKLGRAFEERLSLLHRQGKLLGGVFSGVGQEAVYVGSCYGLQADDIIIPTHRGIGAALTKGADPKVLMAQILGKCDGYSRGKTSYLHSGDLGIGLFGTSSMVGKANPVACGFALAMKMDGRPNVVLSFFGEGASSQGDVHEAMNFASVQKLPVIFICENNLYAYSTPMTLQMNIPEVSRRAAAYGMPGQTVSGNDLPATVKASREAVQRAREGEGPTLLEFRTFRWHGHSEHDPAQYRTEEEFIEWKARDPLPRAALYLREKGLLDDDSDTDITSRVEQVIAEAVEFAEQSPFPNPEEAQHDVLGPVRVD